MDLLNRPPRSSNLAFPNYFLWGYIKSVIYADKSATIDALETNIVRDIREIRPAMVQNRRPARSYQKKRL